MEWSSLVFTEDFVKYLENAQKLKLKVQFKPEVDNTTGEQVFFQNY